MDQIAESLLAVLSTTALQTEFVDVARIGLGLGALVYGIRHAWRFFQGLAR